jgi:hypothetical protein
VDKLAETRLQVKIDGERMTGGERTYYDRLWMARSMF